MTLAIAARRLLLTTSLTRGVGPPSGYSWAVINGDFTIYNGRPVFISADGRSLIYI